MKPSITSKSTTPRPFGVSWMPLGKKMREWLLPYWKLNRSPVSADIDKLVYGLKDRFPEGRVLELQSGEECHGAWVVPENWTLKKAQLKRQNGEVLIDAADNPLHVWAHCQSFKGTISKEELIDEHIVSDPNRPDEFLYVYMNAFVHKGRGWGFSAPHKLVETLNDESYEVDIEAQLDNDNTLKIFDLHLAGESEETVLLMAHTCHPAQVSDGIANIAVLLELYELLKETPNRRYSYRFLFSPEFFGAAAYLKIAEMKDIENLSAGLYLDMAGTHEPLGMMTSWNEGEAINLVLENVLQYHTNSSYVRPYRKLWGNDEVFYDAPYFNIPTVGLGRNMFREYHYNTDDPEHLNDYHMVETLWVLQRMCEAWEKDTKPRLKYQGPLYISGTDIGPVLSKLGLSIAGFSAIERQCNGEQRISVIAQKCSCDIFLLLELFEELQKRDWVELL